ncbi:hypothetical protein JOQ06_004748 [Pogonophryne albipinna]|uniref:Ig-like domain-containing protein n=1 Tax=Pogonophryne albipinna TaxID=1090488 RepID=A0AAD6FBT2_9TELE|nr:hypothetical protein JOQ06_004748 [Pogonophryne albipinna]
MDEFKRIKMSLFLVLLLQFTGAAIGQRFLYLSVRVGDEATLPCNNVIHDQDECDGTSWFFSDSGSAVELVRRGQILDRLRVTEKCSLVVKKVTEEDASLYTCRQFNRSGAQQGPGSQVLLSVVTMTEHQVNDEVTLRCSVTRYWERRLKVKWLLQGQDVDKDNSDIKTSQSYCSASITFSLQSSGWWWWIIIVVIVGVAALTIITVAVIRRKRTQGQKPQTDENIVRYGVDDGTVNYDNIRPPDGGLQMDSVTSTSLSELEMKPICRVTV